MNTKNIALVGMLLLSLAVFPVSDSFAIINTVDLQDEDYDEWNLIGNAVDKQTALSDNDKTTAIASGFNNDKQSFFVDVPLQLGTSVTSVTMFAEWQKGLDNDGSSYAGNSKFRFFISSGQSEFLEQSTFSADTALQSGKITYMTNPLTGNEWTVDDFDTTSFGVIQETDDKPIWISQFEVRLDIGDTVPPTVFPPSDIVAEGNVPNGAKVSYLVIATDNISSSENITILCATDETPSRNVDAVGDDVFFAHSSINPTVTTVGCTATDEAGNTSEPAMFSVSVSDTIPPAMSLLGKNPDLQLKQDDTETCPAYVDPGATVDDIVDENPTLDIENTVDLCNVSVYTNNYIGTDSTSNSNIISRNINVVDYYVAGHLPQIDFGSGYSIILENIGDMGTADEQIVTLQSIRNFGEPSQAIRDTIDVVVFEDLVTINGELVPSGLFLSETILFHNSIDPSFQTLLVEQGDVIIGTYDELTKKMTKVSSVVSAGRAGLQPNQIDPIRFFESDTYNFGQSATIIVKDYDKTGSDSGVLSVDITLTSAMNGNSITVPATRSADGDDFVTQQYFTFIEQGVNGGFFLLVESPEDTVTASTNVIQETATANLIEDAQTVLVDNYVPDLNDKVNCINSDADADTVCDAWEDNVEFVGLDIVTNDGKTYQLTCDPAATYASDPTGATVCPDPNVKDLYVEVDYMQFHKPNMAAIEDYANVLLNSNAIGAGGAVVGIHPHIFIDEQIDHFDNMGFGSGTADAPDFFDLKLTYFGQPSEKDPNVDSAQTIADRLNAKRQVFHYAIFGHNNANGGSGIGEVNGNDFAVTLGDFPAHIGTTGQQSATMLHETGHNLGLRHGGPDSPFTKDDELNCKPNYPSVMNYLYQFEGWNDNNGNGIVDLGEGANDGGLLANRPLDLSRWAYTIINEGRLYDSQKITGIPPLEYLVGGVNVDYQKVTNAVPIDWDQGPLTSAYMFSVNQFDEIPGCGIAEDDQDGNGIADTTLLRSYKDWTAINMNFRDQGTWDNGLLRFADPTPSPQIQDNFTVEPENVTPIVIVTDDLIVNGVIEIRQGDFWYPALIEVGNPHSSEIILKLDPGDGGAPTTFGPVSRGDELIYDDHQWNIAGTYSLTITVTNEFVNFCDDPGCVGIETITVVVLPAYDIEVDSPLVNSQYKTGRTIPVKFSVLDNGTPIETPTLPFLTTIQGNVESPANSNGRGSNDNSVIFDSSTVSYSFNLNTKNLSHGPLCIAIHTDDGGSKCIDIILK